MALSAENGDDVTPGMRRRPASPRRRAAVSISARSSPSPKITNQVSGLSAATAAAT